MAASCGDVQNAHLRAWRGISLRHSLHGLVSDSVSTPVLRRAINALTGRTTKKNTAIAIEINAISALMNSPYANLLWLIVNDSVEKSGLPMIAATIGVNRSFTRAVTTAPNAAPITIPTARSTTFPRSKNALKSLAIRSPCLEVSPVRAGALRSQRIFAACSDVLLRTFQEGDALDVMPLRETVHSAALG